MTQVLIVFIYKFILSLCFLCYINKSYWKRMQLLVYYYWKFKNIIFFIYLQHLKKIVYFINKISRILLIRKFGKLLAINYTIFKVIILVNYYISYEFFFNSISNISISNISHLQCICKQILLNHRIIMACSFVLEWPHMSWQWQKTETNI